MKITIESTPDVIALRIGGHDVPARAWEGRTESGIPVLCFTVVIVPEIPQSDPRIDEFEREFKSLAEPRTAIEDNILRMYLED